MVTFSSILRFFEAESQKLPQEAFVFGVLKFQVVLFDPDLSYGQQENIHQRYNVEGHGISCNSGTTF